MAKVQHTVTGCVPVDRSVIEAYVALVTTNAYATEKEEDRQGAEAARVLAENGRVSAEAERDRVFGNDHTRANTDHGIAIEDHATAVSDHGKASTDHTIAGEDHTQAGSDHTRAVNDHSTAADDHTLAGADHTTASADHTTAGNDHTTAGTDHTTAGTDHTRAGEDHTLAAADHVTAAADHATWAGYRVVVKSVGDSAPGSPSSGDKWYKTTDNKIYSYDGSSWDSGVAATTGATIVNSVTNDVYVFDGSKLDNYAEDISQLGQELNGGTPDIFEELEFEQGGISTTNGSNQVSNQQVRSDFIVTPSLRVTVTNGSVYVYGWNGDTYLSAVGWKTGTNDFEIAGATKYKVVFKLPSGNLTPAGVGDLGASVYVPIRGQVVKCVSQTLNDTEKQTARENIGAEEAGRLDPYVLDGYAPMDISSVEESSYYIQSGNTYHQSNGTTDKSAGKYIPIVPGKGYKLVNNLSVDTYYAVLKDINNISESSATPHWATGYSARIELVAGGSATFTTPADGHYLYILVKSSSGTNYAADVEYYHEAIDTKIATLESEVADLAEDVEDVEIAINGGYVAVDVSGVSLDDHYIYSDNHYRKAGSGTYTRSRFVPIVPGEQYKLENNTSVDSPYAVLKNINNVSSGNTPHWATGYSGRVALNSGESSTFIAPADGYYLCVLAYNASGIDIEPDIFVNNASLANRVTEIENAVSVLDMEVDKLKIAVSGDVGTKTSVFENIQIPVDVNGYEIPTTFGMIAALKKAAQGCQIKYVAKKAYPTLTDPTGASAGEKTGFPYSSVKEMAKFIHWHISERTFMTAINNEYGLFYTEDVANNNSRSDYGYTYHGVNCGPYYGMVCNIFALWCLGYPVPFDTAQFAYLASNGVLVRLNNQTAQAVHICDLVWYQGHTALVTSVKHDEYGNVTEVKITESMGHVHTTTFTASQFDTYLHITNDAILYRPTFVYKNTYQPSEFIGVRGEATPSAYEYNDDICFFAGDYAAWKLGENAWVNYTKGSFTGMKIYKDDTLVDTITLDNDSSVHKVEVTSYISGTGKYKACLTDGVNDSDFTYWQMVEATASYSGGVVSFESANGTPWYIQVCSSNGSAYCWYEITQADINDGEVALDLAAMVAEQYGTVTGTQYVRVAFKADYGAVVSDMIQI